MMLLPLNLSIAVLQYSAIGITLSEIQRSDKLVVIELMQFPSRINLILNDRKLQAKANIEVPAKVWLLEDYSREDPAI